MCKRIIYFLVFTIYIMELGARGDQKRRKLLKPETESEMKKSITYRNQTDYYTNWSAWSRCIDCIQRRTKKCVSSKCNNSRMYEERPCGKKRCRRKAKHKQHFNVVHINESSNFLTKQGPSDIWSKWSNWSPCSTSCKTYRLRNCKKPGRCKKQQQSQTGYCYHENSRCEEYVLYLLEHSQRNNYDRFDYQVYQNNPRTHSNPKSNHCGRPFRKSKMLKIIGGTASKRYKWPWHVAILNAYDEVFCGGTLIASRWVLTAAHCIRSYLRVRLNEHDLHARDGRELEMTVYKMFPHPKFNHKTVENDIALLLLPYITHIPVACLPNKKPKVGQLCSVMGWGKVKSSDVYGINILHEVKLPLTSATTCKRSYRNFAISPSMFCAGYRSGGKDTCAGDSGGGLMCLRKYKNSSTQPAYTVQGITSFGDGCGRRNKYGIYTAVIKYRKWIQYITDHYS